MNNATEPSQPTRKDVLGCAAKLVCLLVHAKESEDHLACLLAATTDIEAFASQASTDLEHTLANAMRIMQEEMIRRAAGSHHSHAKAAKAFTQHHSTHSVRFKRLKKL